MLRSLALFLVAGVMLLAPYSASAATVNFFGPIVPEECNCEASSPDNAASVPSAPEWGCVLATLQNLVAFAISIGVMIVTLMMAYAGILWIASPFNPHNREEGRTLLINSVIGLVITLCSWLLVDFVMKFFYNEQRAAEFAGGQAQGASYLPWESILGGNAGAKCFEVTSSVSGPTGTGFVTSRRGGGGSCSVASAGPCSPSNLTATFGAKAEEASKICIKESSGNPQNVSRTDKLTDGSPYSVGLFQINLTNSFSTRVNGKNCSEAFSGACQGRQVVQQSGNQIGRCSQTIVDRTLYDACVLAAKNPATNIAEAKKLYDGDWGRWRNSALACRLPY